jgi:thiol-disulfide isomerase/thioredoxin
MPMHKWGLMQLQLNCTCFSSPVFGVLAIMFRLTLVVGVFALSASQASAGSTFSNEVKQILGKAQKAAAELKSISYDGSLRGEGQLAGAFTDYAGKVQVEFAGTPESWHVLIAGTRTMANTRGTGLFHFSSDGKKAFLIDEQKRVFTTGPVPQGRVAEREAILPSGHFGKSAYAEELRAQKVELTGMAVVSDVECDVLDVFYDAEGRRRARLHIAKSDHIIRRIERPIMYASGGQTKEFNSTISLSLENIQLNSVAAITEFSATKPEGYSEGVFPASTLNGRAIAAGPSAKSDSPPAGLRQIAVSPPAQRVGGLKAGDPAPEWTLKDAEGNDVSLKGLRGKVVVLDFWATWCGPCKMAMPGVQKMSEKYKDQPVAVYGVNCLERGRSSNPLAVIKEKRVTFGQLLEGTSVASQYGVRAIPSFAVIGKDGMLLYLGSGYDQEAIERAVESGLRG